MAKKSDITEDTSTDRVIEYSHTQVIVSTDEPQLLVRHSSDRPSLQPAIRTIVREFDTNKMYRYDGDLKWTEIK